MSRMIIYNTFTTVRDGYFELQLNQRFYVNAVVMLIVFLVSSAISWSPFAKGSLFLFFVFWIIAIYNDLIPLYKRVYESVLGKIFLAILFSLGTNLAIAGSSQLVNGITGIDPSKFPHTIALLSILNIPIFISIGSGIIYFILLLVTPLLLMFHMLPDESMKEVLIPGFSASSSIPYRKLTRAIQLISLVTFCGLAFTFSQKAMQSYDAFLTDTGRSFLFKMEMYPKAQCDIETDSRVAFLSDEKVLIGEKNSSGIVFKVRACKSLPNPALQGTPKQ